MECLLAMDHEQLRLCPHLCQDKEARNNNSGKANPKIPQLPPLSQLGLLRARLTLEEATRPHPHTFSLTQKIACFTKGLLSSLKDSKRPHNRQFVVKSTGKGLVLKGQGSLVKTSLKRAIFLVRPRAWGWGSFPLFPQPFKAWSPLPLLLQTCSHVTYYRLVVTLHLLDKEQGDRRIPETSENLEEAPAIVAQYSVTRASVAATPPLVVWHHSRGIHV